MRPAACAMRQPEAPKRLRAASRYLVQEVAAVEVRRSRIMRRAMLNASRQTSRDHGVASTLETAAVDFRVSGSFDTSALLVSGLGPVGCYEHSAGLLWTMH